MLHFTTFHFLCTRQSPVTPTKVSNDRFTIVPFRQSDASMMLGNRSQIHSKASTQTLTLTLGVNRPLEFPNSVCPKGIFTTQ